MVLREKLWNILSEVFGWSGRGPGDRLPGLSHSSPAHEPSAFEVSSCEKQLPSLSLKHRDLKYVKETYLHISESAKKRSYSAKATYKYDPNYATFWEGKTVGSVSREDPTAAKGSRGEGRMSRWRTEDVQEQ